MGSLNSVLPFAMFGHQENISTVCSPGQGRGNRSRCEVLPVRSQKLVMLSRQRKGRWALFIPLHVGEEGSD